jgi:hypothetical protein
MSVGKTNRRCGDLGEVLAGLARIRQGPSFYVVPMASDICGSLPNRSCSAARELFASLHRLHQASEKPRGQQASSSSTDHGGGKRLHQRLGRMYAGRGYKNGQRNFSSPGKGVQFLGRREAGAAKKPRRLTGATYRRCYGHGPLVLMSV